MKAEIRKLTKEHTIHLNIKVTNEFKVRMFLATIFFKIGAYILNCNLDIK